MGGPDPPLASVLQTENKHHAPHGFFGSEMAGVPSVIPKLHSWRGCQARMGGPDTPLASVLQAENKHHAPHGFFGSEMAGVPSVIP